MKKIKTLILFLSLSIFLGFIFKKPVINSLIKINILKNCYDRSENFLDVYQQEGLSYYSEDLNATEKSYYFLERLPQLNNLNSIPRITHQVYLTSKVNPLPLNDFYQALLKQNFSGLHEVDNTWTHYIWVNNESSISSDIKSFQNVQIKFIDELNKHKLYAYILDVLKKAENNKAYFAEAADLVRLLTVQEFGGVYLDLDYEIYNPESLATILSKFDFVGGREMTIKLSNYGNAFFAAKPDHPIINNAIDLATRNNLSDAHPDYIKFPCRESVRIYFNGPPLMTTSYFKRNNLEGNRDLILPSWMIFNARFARFKNKSCNYTGITSDEFNKATDNIQNLINEYRKNPIAEGIEEVEKNNIYYKINLNNQYPIIGADMFCGNWIKGSNFKRKYYWNW